MALITRSLIIPNLHSLQTVSTSALQDVHVAQKGPNLAECVNCHNNLLNNQNSGWRTFWILNFPTHE